MKICVKKNSAVRQGEFKADDQDTLEEKTKEIEDDVKLSTSRNAVNVNGSEVDVDGKSLHEKNLLKINCELLNHDITEVKLDDLKKVEDFQM